MIASVQQNRQVEKPTAREYWKDFANQYPEFNEIDVELIVNKSRNLKQSYQKAISWKNTTGQGVTDESTIDNEIKKRCVHYNSLHEIYSDRPNVQPRAKFDSDRVGQEFICNGPLDANGSVFEIDLCGEYFDVVGNESFSHLVEEDIVFEPDQIDVGSTEQNQSSTSINTRQNRDIPEIPEISTNSKENNTPRKRTRNNALKKVPTYEKNSLHILKELELKRYDVQQKKIKLEEEKFAYQKGFDERRLEMEVKNQEAEMKLKEFEIKQNREIREMEIKKELEIARMQLEFKYGRKENEGDFV